MPGSPPIILAPVVHEEHRDANAGLARHLLTRALSGESLASANWAIVTAFYAALHHTELFLAAEKRANLQRWGHARRNHFIALSSSLRPVRLNYLALFEASRHARYDGVLYAAEDAAEYLSYLSAILAVEPPRPR